MRPSPNRRGILMAPAGAIQVAPLALVGFGRDRRTVAERQLPSARSAPMSKGCRLAADVSDAAQRATAT